MVKDLPVHRDINIPYIQHCQPAIPDKFLYSKIREKRQPIEACLIYKDERKFCSTKRFYCTYMQRIFRLTRLSHRKHGPFHFIKDSVGMLQKTHPLWSHADLFSHAIKQPGFQLCFQQSNLNCNC